MEDNIRIQQMLLHIVDISNPLPILTNNFFDLNIDIREYITNHIQKYIINDNMKTCFFNSENAFYDSISMLVGEDEAFIDFANNFSEHLYSMIYQNPDIPSADMIYVKFTFNQIPFVGILKMNYKTSYMHFVENNADSNDNKIVMQRTLLPNANQSLDEVIMIDLSEGNVKILEKKYEIDGSKEFYLSKYILQCDFQKSNYEAFTTIDKAISSVNKEFQNNDIEKKLEVRKALYESIEETGGIDIEEVTSMVSENNNELKEVLTTRLKENGVENEAVNFDSEKALKKLSNQHIKTDMGIEIKIPTSHYGNNDLIEFINNPDGTISIVIKNIQKLNAR